MDLITQIVWLFILAIPVACISWTVTHEEIFKEVMDYCNKKKDSDCPVLVKKFYYLFTCEYCLSHYLAIFFIALTGFTLLLDDTRGFLIAFFALVWVANVYMSLFAFIRIGIKQEKTEVNLKEQELQEKKNS